MAARRKLDQAHLELATRIETWAAEFNQVGDPYLVKILYSLRERRNWPMWSSIDAFTLLPHPKGMVSSKLPKVSFYFTLIRNILVFAPVALTWSAVSHATSAFSIYVSRNGNSVVNFLEFWQNGFGLLAREWIIGTVAFLDFLLIALVIFFTILISFIDRKIEDRIELTEEEVDKSRTELAIGITEFFYSKRTLTDPVLRSNVSSSMNQILGASESLNKSAKALEKTTREATKENLKLFMTKEKARRKTDS